MSVAAPPPSFRDFEVYRLIRVDRKSTREAAAETGVSQTRVRQIVERVAEFLLEAVPEGGDAKLPQRLELAKVLAAERLDALYGEAMEGWRSSKGVQRIARDVESPGRPPKHTVNEKPTQGDCKYLQAASKLAQLAGKSPAYSLLSYFPTESWDCSPTAAESPPVGAASESKSAVSLPEKLTSLLEACRELRQLNGGERPAQPAEETSALSARDRNNRRAFLSDAG